MRFLIIGDSWAQGEFHPESYERRHSLIVHTGITAYLQQAGHDVNNISCPGDNNLRQLRLAKQELERNSYDQVIWFITEPMRNIYPYSPFPDDRDIWNYEANQYSKDDELSYDDMLEDWFTLTFTIAQSIYDQHLIPFFLVGGMSPVHDCIKNYSFHNGMVRSWGKDITGTYQPHNSPYHTRRFVEDNDAYLNDKRMNREMQQCLDWEESQRNSRYFICYHPDRQAHENLTKTILDEINK